MATTTARADHRTPNQAWADENIAAGVERFIVTDAATGWTVHEATDERRRLSALTAGSANNAIAAGGLNVPFLWNGNVYRVTGATHRDGHTDVTVTPPDPAFEAEVRRRIDAAPHHVLTFYQGFGFVCFAEDHAKYRG